MSTDLAVIIVSWNVRPLLERCLASLRRARGVKFIPPDARSAPEPRAFQPGLYRALAIVVDNASSDGSAELVRSSFPWVHLIASEENLGFTAANNLAIKGQMEAPTPRLSSCCSIPIPRFTLMPYALWWNLCTSTRK